ncbi:MAG: ChbG/HpnK family deacetylase [Syntrophaceae bacterium]
MHERPRVIINADDLGLSPQINAGIFKGVEAGVVTDVSVMSKAPFVREAAARLKSYGIASAGIHIDLDGLLGWSSPGRERYNRSELQRRFEQSAFRKTLATEARDQIEKFLGLGLIPSHIDAHHHVHGFPVVFAIILKLMGQYVIPAMRFSRSGYSLPTREDIPWTSVTAVDMEAKLRAHGILYCDNMLEGTGLIGHAGPGTTEIVAHPGLGGDAWRDEELKTLLTLGSSAIRERFDLISYLDLQPAFKD